MADDDSKLKGYDPWQHAMLMYCSYKGDTFLWNDWRELNKIAEIRMEGADLSWANLQEVDLHKADLGNANLQKSKLQKATFASANLQEANLHKAILAGANFQEANLWSANLQ